MADSPPSQLLSIILQAQSRGEVHELDDHLSGKLTPRLALKDWGPAIVGTVFTFISHAYHVDSKLKAQTALLQKCTLYTRLHVFYTSKSNASGIIIPRPSFKRGENAVHGM